MSRLNPAFALSYFNNNQTEGMLRHDVTLAYTNPRAEAFPHFADWTGSEDSQGYAEYSLEALYGYGIGSTAYHDQSQTVYSDDNGYRNQGQEVNGDQDNASFHGSQGYSAFLTDYSSTWHDA